MLYIFNQDEELQAVLKNEGTACFYTDPVHKEKINGENTFTFSIPADHSDAKYVIEGNLVAFEDLDHNWQLFEIKTITDLHKDTFNKKAYCEHAFYELYDDFITDKRPQNTDALSALTLALDGTRWSVGNVDDLGLNSTNFYYQNVLSAIHNIVDTWGGELQFRVNVQGGIIQARYVDILAQRGTETGKIFKFGRHMTEIERIVDSSGITTALYGRGKGVEVEETGGYGRRLTFADVSWSTALGDPVDKPLGQEWVGDPDALTLWGRPGGRHRFGVFVDEEETDPEKLLLKTWEALQERKNPRATYRMGVNDLERVTGLEHEKVRLGDTCSVIDRVFVPELLIKARIVEIERNLLQPENTQITLGNFIPTITDSIRRIDNAVRKLQNTPINASWLEGIINTLQAEVRAGRGTVTITENNGIMIVDDTENPTRALRLLGGLFAIANSKDPVTGEWNWRTFGDGNGFTADLINVGTMLFDRLKGGSLILGGSNNINGMLQIKNASGDEVVRGNNEGIRVDGGAYVITDMGLDMSLTQLPNLIIDHSFECLEREGSKDQTYRDYAAQVVSSISSWYDWEISGEPRLLISDNFEWHPVYSGQKCIAVNDLNHVGVRVKCKPNTYYYLSGFVAIGYRNPGFGTPKLTVEYRTAAQVPISSASESFSIDTTQFKWQRVGMLLNTPEDCDHIFITIWSADSNYVYWDGLQLVENNKPVRYEPEESLWKHMYESAGMPFMGHIVESGSNSNGNYIRFSDGTQICWHRAAQSDQNCTQLTVSPAVYGGTIYYFTFPAPFTTYPYAVGNVASNGFLNAQCASVTLTGLGVRAWANYSSIQQNVIVGYIAIGRW